MPHKAFLHKNSLLDQFKDDHKHTGIIQSMRAEHTWNNPLTRRKRTKKLNGWIKSFDGKNHIRKLSRFNAIQAHRHESIVIGESAMQNEAMSLKGFIENLSDKLVNKYSLEKDMVKNYLNLHTEEMQELLDDKELSLKEKVLFVRSEITGEQDEKKSEEFTLDFPVIVYKGDAENAEKAVKYLWEKIPEVKSAYFACEVKPKDGNNFCRVYLAGPKTFATQMFMTYRDMFNNEFWNDCDADPQGWVNPQTIAGYDVATPRQESKKLKNEMVGNKKWVIRIKRLGKNYYVCSSSFRVNKEFRYPSLGGPFVCSDWDITERDIAKYDNYNDAKKAWDGMAQALRGGLPFYKEGEDYEIVQVNFSMMGESKKHEGYGGTKSVMSIWGNRPRDVYPEVSYSSVNDMYNTLLKYGYGDMHPIYYKNNSPEQIKGHILGYFKWTPTNSDADIEADALAAATMIKNNFNKSESKEPADEKLGYEKGHKNSRGDDAPWVIRSHEDNRVLASFATEKEAKEHLKRMKQYSKGESKKSESLFNKQELEEPVKSYISNVLSDLVVSFHWGEDGAERLVDKYNDVIMTNYIDGDLSAYETAKYINGKENNNPVESKKKQESKKNEGHLELVDTIVVPKWLWDAFYFADEYGETLNEEEEEILADFKVKYADAKYHLETPEEEADFRSRNDFDEYGGPCYEINVYEWK